MSVPDIAQRAHRGIRPAVAIDSSCMREAAVDVLHPYHVLGAPKCTSAPDVTLHARRQLDLSARHAWSYSLLVPDIAEHGHRLIPGIA
eukprot:3370079-Rhodomonas_salina.7